MQFLIAYLGSAVVFFGLDFIWLKYVAKNFYRSELDHLLLDEFKLGYAGIFYVFYVAAIVFLVVLPHISTDSLKTVMLYGAVLGLAAYGTYDMTNMSTLKDWSLKVSIVDMFWGGFVTAMGAMGGFWALKYFSGN